ncbi:MAG: hypothetical protein GC153_05420 [Alphaproteobacteria bacterium]|nr:hypothetical protein [Alphaproteobacteria bacterium]
MKIQYIVPVLAAAVPFCIAAPASADPAQTPEVLSQTESGVPPAVQVELRHQAIEQALAPIKSKADLDRYLSTATVSPLDWLSSNAKWEFIGSLVFHERGLASYRYDVLAKELTPTQIYQLLSLFGAQHTTSMIKGAKIVTDTDKLIMEGATVSSNVISRGPPGEDHENFKCIGDHNCIKSLDYICMTGC